MKDETAGNEVLEFAGLRAKLYAYRKREKEDKKGSRKHVIKQSITFDDYKRCLFSRQKQNRLMNLIRSQRAVQRVRRQSILVAKTTSASSKRTKCTRSLTEIGAYETKPISTFRGDSLASIVWDIRG